jgi:hypothetical protein
MGLANGGAAGKGAAADQSSAKSFKQKKRV